MTTSRKAYLSVIASATLLLCAAQAQAQNFSFSQAFNSGSTVGTVSGTFVGNDADSSFSFDASEMTFLTLNYNGTVPTLVGTVNLSFTPPDIVVNPSVTLWVDGDQNISTLGTGFFLRGTSATGTQMTWVAGHGNGFGVGNLGGSGGDPQNSTFDFGKVSFFPSINSGNNLPLGPSAFSQTYVNVITTPIPEPATYLMMLGGIAAIAIGARRRAA